MTFPAPSTSAPAVIEVRWRRLSARMLLIHPVREVVRFIPVLLGIFFAGNKNGQGHWWSLLGAAALIGLSILRWATTRYQITDEQVQLKTGFFRRRVIATPADRVRTVDVTEHALHRMLGLAKVSIGTGNSDRKKDGLILDGLDAAEARALRGELLHDRTATPTRTPSAVQPLTVTVTQPPLEEELLRLDPGWVRFAPFTFSGFVTALAILGVGWNAITQSHVNAGKIGAVRATSHYLRHGTLWIVITEVFVIALAIVVLLAMIGYLLSYWNFQLTRHRGGTLHVSRGLITSRSTSIEDRRLRGVEISETLPLRGVSGARLEAVMTGLRMGRGAERGGTVLAPPAPRAVVTALARHVLSDRVSPAESERLVSGELIPHSPAARRRRVVRSTFPFVLLTAGLALASATVGLSLGWAASAGGLTLLAIPLGLDRYASLGHVVDGGFLVTRYGSVVRRRVILETDGIIGWNFRQTLLQRRMKLVRATATTAAGAQRYYINDVSGPESVRIALAATPGLLDQFLA